MNCPRRCVLTKQEILLGKGTWAESSRVREPRRTALPLARGLGLHGDGISFWVVFSQSFWLRVLPGDAHLVQPRWVPERRILGGGRTCGVSFWPFLNSSGCWWLISSVFLTRTSCRKTTPANSNYGAWSGWAVSVYFPWHDQDFGFWSWLSDSRILYQRRKAIYSQILLIKTAEF